MRVERGEAPIAKKETAKSDKKEEKKEV